MVHVGPPRESRMVSFHHPELNHVYKDPFPYKITFALCRIRQYARVLEMGK